MSDKPTVAGALVDPAKTITRIRICPLKVDPDEVASKLAIEFKESADGELFRLTFDTPEEFETFGDELFAKACLAWPGRFDS